MFDQLCTANSFSDNSIQRRNKDLKATRKQNYVNM